MDSFLKICNLIFVNIISNPEFFIGIIVFVGYLLIGKKVYEAFAGFLKAAIGFLILGVGSSGLVKNFSPILKGLDEKFSMSAVVIDPNFGYNAANQALNSIGLTASWSMLSLLVGFSWNIILVLLKKHTKINTLFITGHIMVKQAAVATWIVFMAIPELRNIFGALSVGILIGTYWSVFSNLTLEATNNLAGGEAGFAVGHQQMLGVWIADKISAKLGDKEKNIDDLKLPGCLNILSDNVVATGTMMLIFFGIILFAIGEPTLKIHDSNGFNGGIIFITYVIKKSLSFAVNLVILMTGVRMFVSELVESFTGISEKLLKGAVPAVDCAVVFGYASQNTILFGFLLGALGQLVAIIGLLLFKSPLMIIPGFVPLFFDNATIAIFANKRGGIKAATIVSFFSGVIQVLGSFIAVKLFMMESYGGWIGNFDWDTFWPIVGFVMKRFSSFGLIICVLFMLMIPHITNKRKEENLEKIEEEDYV